MKTDKIVTESEKEELRQWLQRESPLTSFARSLRMEELKASSAETKETGTEDADLLAGIDLDALPAEAREALIARNEQFKSIKTQATTAETKATEALEQARKHQSRADRFHETLKNHNLLETQTAPKPSKMDVLEKTIYNNLVQGGMDAKQAQGMAKVFMAAAPDLISAAKDETLQSVVGLAHNVGNIQADRAIDLVFANDKTGFTQIPEVRDGVLDQVKFLVSQGQQVDTDSVATLVDMQYGKYIRENPEGVKAKVTQQPTNLHSRGSRGNMTAPTHTDSGSNKAPVAANPETAAGAAATLTLMLKGVKTTKR